MTLNKKTSGLKLIIAVLIGAALGAGIVSILQNDHMHQNDHVYQKNKEEKKLLYWVAPMDSNYRRDEPGKSPMGMDLVPVYENNTANTEVSPGTVTIAPNVVNNLGVRTAIVKQKKMDTEISTVGYVQYDQDKLFHIHPRVDGWIETLYVKATGAPVQKGQALYTLYSPQLVNAQEELLLALKRNNNSLIIAAKNRLKALQLSSKFIQNLEKTKEVHQTVTFYSPQTGVVNNLKVREGFYVKPDTTLLSIGTLDQVWIEAEVFERDSVLIKVGSPVSMTLDYLPATHWNGTVDYIYPALNKKTRTLRVRLRFDNLDHQLKPNMFAQVSISANQPQSSIVVPKEAVIRTGKQERVVLALGEGQFKSIAVTIGRVDAEYIEILTGLNEEDVVVTSAQFLIDSESSKDSDFKRMNHDEIPDTVWIKGHVNRVMAGHRVVNITHDPVEAWDWPEMTMDFRLSEKLDTNFIKSGQSLHFEVKKITDDASEKTGFEITGVHIMSEPEPEPELNDDEFPSAEVIGQINHVDQKNRTLNISREAIEKWGRPAATMDFMVSDNINIADFIVGDNVIFTFEVRDDLIITKISRQLKQHEQKNVVDHSHH